MIYRIFPCIVKHHGSIKYLKYIVSLSRQNGFKSKTTNVKTLATASSLPASCVKENSQDACQTENYSRVKNVVRDEETSSKLPCENKHLPFSSENNLLNNNTLDKTYNVIFKPVVKPDVLVSAPESSDMEEVEKGNAKSVKLLNTVKPSDLEWHKEELNIRLLPSYYKSLSKFRLTGLVVLTTLAGYGMAPGPFEPVTLLCMTIGTALTSAAANATNQILEVPYDSQMNRTKNRVLVRGLLTPLHAFTFAACSATIGLATLYFGTSTLTAVLGAVNLVLYTSVYTPLKRCSIFNTWVGSIVGAIPPLMGWSACTGTLSSGALLMGAILYAWQFPHFNALSWRLRPDYSKAGYRMTSVIDPGLCCRTALRYSISMLIICSSAPLLDLTTWTFAFDSFPLNCYLIYCAWQFYNKADDQSSRRLFKFSLIHLPTLMFLMFIGKKHVLDNDKKDKL